MENYYFNDFKVVEMKYNDENKPSYQVLMKPHNVKEYDPKKPAERTLFIINLPPYITEECLRQLLGKFGKVTDVFLHNEPNSRAPPEVLYPNICSAESVKSFKVGYVVFENAKTVKKIMNSKNDSVFPMDSVVQLISTGLEKWYSEYNSSFVSLNLLKEESEKIINDYDVRKKKEKAAVSDEPDEEGWIVVNTSNKRKRPHPEKSDSTRNSRNKKRRQRKTQLLNFYAFQNKEAKLEHLAEHRKRYEEDRKRLEMMKSARKFKPL